MGENTPLEEAIINLKYLMFKQVLTDNGLDFGKYPIEEIVKMYNNHKGEIILD